MGRIAWLGYIVFLGVYSWWKYSVAAPADFSSVYAQSVAILVLMTGAAPFLATFLLLKALPLRRLAASATGAIFGAIFCVAGYAAFWQLFIAGNTDAPALLEVALRGLGWGALQGGLASIAANH